MSYDISLYPRTPGQDWDSVIEADQQEGPAMDQAQLDSGLATFRRIEARLREQLTEPVEVWVAEETDGDVVGELSATESGLQVELYDRSASVSFPARPREDRARFLDQVRRAVRIVATETGYEAYDPQTGRSFDGLIEEEGVDVDDLTYTAPAASASVAAGETVGETGAPAAAGPAGAAALQQMDPRMLRRRAILYMVLGAILAIFAFLRFAEGDTGWFAWLIAGFAAFNLLAGAMLRGLSKQAEARQAQSGDAPGDPTPGGPTTP